ncbi:MAG TPA: beta-eliminating lyase-related protein [Methylomirabilota bacterium]|nr:beta-eliminating lyase-related protein [Methylomirabilota bacterium]
MARPSDDLDRYRSSCARFLSGHGHSPAAELLASMADAEADTSGAGGAVEALEAETAEVLGKPAAVFMPSGTMAQQIALRIHADHRDCRAVAFHSVSPLSNASRKVLNHSRRRL